MQHFLKLIESTAPRARSRMGLMDSRLRRDATPLEYVAAATLSHNRLLVDIKGVIYTVAGIFFQGLSDHPEIVYISWFWQGSRQINSDVKCIHHRIFTACGVDKRQHALICYLCSVFLQECKDRNAVWCIPYFVSSPDRDEWLGIQSMYSKNMIKLIHNAN